MCFGNLTQRTSNPHPANVSTVMATPLPPEARAFSSSAKDSSMPGEGVFGGGNVLAEDGGRIAGVGKELAACGNGVAGEGRVAGG